MLAQLPNQLQTVKLAFQAVVTQQDVDSHGAQTGQRLIGTGKRPHNAAPTGQQRLHGLAANAVILDQSNLAAQLGHHHAHRLLRLHLPLAHRRLKPEAGSLTNPGPQARGIGQQMQYLPTDTQPQPHALIQSARRVTQLGKLLKDALLISVGQPAAVVDHGNT